MAKSCRQVKQEESVFIQLAATMPWQLTRAERVNQQGWALAPSRQPLAAVQTDIADRLSSFSVHGSNRSLAGSGGGKGADMSTARTPDNGRTSGGR